MSASTCSSFISNLGKRGSQRKLVGGPLITSKHTELWQQMYEEAKDGTIRIKNEEKTTTIVQMSESKNKYASAISSLNSKQVYEAFGNQLQAPNNNDGIILPKETYIVSNEKDTLTAAIRSSSLSSCKYNCYSIVLDTNCITIIDFGYNNDENGTWESISMIRKMRVPDLFQLKLIATMPDGNIIESAPWIIEKSTAEAMTNFTRPCNNGSNTKNKCNDNSNVKIKKEKQEIGCTKVQKEKKLKATAFKRMSCGKGALIENSSLGVKVLASEYNDDILYRDGTMSTPLDRHFGILVGIHDSGMIENTKQMHLNISYFKPTRLDFYLNENIQLDKLAAVIYYETTNVTIRSNVEKTSEEIVIGGSTSIGDLNNNSNNNINTISNNSNYPSHSHSIGMSMLSTSPSSSYNDNHDNGNINHVHGYQNVRQTNLREMGLSSPQSGNRFDPLGHNGFNHNSTLNTVNSIDYSGMGMRSVGTVVDNAHNSCNCRNNNIHSDQNGLSFMENQQHDHGQFDQMSMYSYTQYHDSSMNNCHNYGAQ